MDDDSPGVTDGGQGTTTGGTRAYQRLSVNINMETAAILRQARKNGLSLTEAIRRAVGLLGFFQDAQTRNVKIYTEDPQGQRAEVHLI